MVMSHLVLESTLLISIIICSCFNFFVITFAKIKSNKIEIFIPNSIYDYSSFAVIARVLYYCELENKSR